MNDTIKSEKEFKIGSDFELHTLKNKSHKGLILRVNEVAKKSNFLELQYMNLGFTLVTPIILGVFLGSYIDSLLHSRPIATIMILVLGVFLSFYNLFRMLKKH